MIKAKETDTVSITLTKEEVDSIIFGLEEVVNNYSDRHWLGKEKPIIDGIIDKLKNAKPKWEF